MDEQKAVIEDAQTKDLASKNGDSADELLKKISEVVNSPAKIVDEDLSKSSDKNFLKKIEEIENEANSDSSKALKDNIAAAATSTESVVVGKLVIDINSDVNAKKINENDKANDKNLQIIEKLENSVKSNMKNSTELLIEKQPEEIEKTQINLIDKPNISEPMSVESINIPNNIEEMEIDSVEKKFDMDVDESELSPKEDIDMKESSPKNDNLTSVTDINIEKPENEVLIKENVKNVANIEKEIIPTVEKTTDSVQVNNSKNDDEIKKIKIIENGESATTAKNIDISSSNKNDKEGLLPDANSKDKKLSINDDKCDITKIKKFEKTESLNDEVVQNCLPENKILSDLKNEDLKTNLNSTPISTPTVFNSTPIIKQFEISSENVSKISEAETSQIQKCSEEKFEKSKIGDSTTETETDCGTCTSSESENKTSDVIDKYAQMCKNGIPGITTDEEDEPPAKYLKDAGTIRKSDLPTDTASKPMLGTKKDETYEVNFISNENDIRYFSIEKIELKKTNSNTLLGKTTSISSDQSSYGSVSSLTPFTLPTKSISQHLSEISSATSTSGSQKTIITPLPSSKNITHAFKNKIDLCTFVIEHFTKIRNNISTTSNNTNVMKKNLYKTPSASSPVTSNKRSRKGSLNVTQSEDENDDLSKFKQSTKYDTTTPTKKNELANEYGECVLAKWIDKKYYAGRITGEKPGNKFVVLFEDGASKVLSKDAIVFGEDRILPLKDQSVFALVDEDDYERGIVISIDKTDDKVYYTVKTDAKTVKVTSSDIYLQESQAKIIQKSELGNRLTIGESTEQNQMEIPSNNIRSTRNKRLHASPVTPEAGFSGTKGSKRQKRRQPPQRNRYASTSEVSDTPDESPLSQLSPDVALEAIEGVQPEVQKTVSESEILKSIFLSDIESLGENTALQNILGILPVAEIFRNKCFILTCTVDLKPHRYEQSNMLGENYRNRQFSKIPFVKVDLKKQLEAGGGKVYDHFEDIPKSKYRQCKLIASRPCLTAKYIQCLAGDIKAVSHEWVINCCSSNRLLDHKEYVLPAGWSITKQIFIKWSLGALNEKRVSKQPFSKVYVLLAAQNKDFVEYWNRVCKMSGAEVRLIKSLNDITPSTKGYLVADMDFPQVIRIKAEHFGIQIVSTVWIVESLILGKLCPVNSNRKLRETFQDDDL